MGVTRCRCRDVIRSNVSGCRIVAIGQSVFFTPADECRETTITGNNMKLSSNRRSENISEAIFVATPITAITRGGRGEAGIRILLGMGASVTRKGMLTRCEKVGAFSYRVWEKLQR